MKNAYCILAHRLTSALLYTIEYLSTDSSNVVYLHVDKKSDLREFSGIISSNVFIINERIDVRWGDFSMITATLSLLSYVKVDGYCTLLSGDDFPCVNVKSLREFLSRIDGKDLLHIQDERNSYVDPYLRVKFKYPRFFFKKNRSPFELLLCKVYKVIPLWKNKYGIRYLKRNNIKLYKGTQWFSLSSNSLDKIKRFLIIEPDFLEVFKNSFCPDEIFFQTLAVHLHLPLYYDNGAKNNCLRYVDWESGPDYPKLLDSSDVESVLQSKCLFARKASDKLNEHNMRLFIRD